MRRVLGGVALRGKGKQLAELISDQFRNTEESLAGFVDRMLDDRVRTLSPGFAKRDQFI